MKKLISLFLFFLVFIPPLAHGKENTLLTVAPLPVPTIDYQLPYPGILPDSSVYPIKAIRDKISSLLIGKPMKKAEFDLIKADTRMSAAFSLIEQNKSVSTAQATISEAEDYFSEAVHKTNEANAQGIDTHEFVKRLSLSNQKHLEIMEKITQKIDKKDVNKIELLKKRIQTLGREIDQIR